MSDTPTGDDAEQGATFKPEILRIYASDMVQEAIKSGVPGEFYLSIAKDWSRAYANPRLEYHQCVDFFVSRYVYYRRHQEKDASMSSIDAPLDGFERLLRIENGIEPYDPPPWPLDSELPDDVHW